MVLLFATSKKYDKVLYNWLSPSLNNCHLHEIALFFVLPTYVEIIPMRWLHDPIVKKLCQNPWNRLALLDVPKVLTDFTLTYRKALIPDGQGAIKREHKVAGLIRFSQSSQYMLHYKLAVIILKDHSLYCYSLAGAWTGIDQWWVCSLGRARHHTIFVTISFQIS